jgi:hypothetical protein
MRDGELPYSHTLINDMIASCFEREAEERLRHFLQHRNWTPSEFWVIDELGTVCSMPGPKLISRAVDSSHRCGSQWEISEREAHFGLLSLIASGYVQNVDSSVLAEINFHVAADPEAIGPVESLPQVGDVDLTVKGAHTYVLMCEEVFRLARQYARDYCVRELDASHIEICATTMEVAALAFFESVFLRERVVSASDFQDIGPWRSRWWKRFDRGWRIDVVIEPDE